jgi:thioredoxin 1
MQKLTPLVFIFLLLTTSTFASETGRQQDLPQIPVDGLVTMLDLGARKCIPCKMMAPILKELKKEYRGKAAIVFIDVWQHQEEVQKYRIRAIPTQIFFDKNGREVLRHVGFMDKKSIVDVLEKLVVD